MDFGELLLAMQFKKIAAEGLLEKAIYLIHIEKKYDEAIHCLHKCLNSTQNAEPFEGIQVTAYIHLGLAYILKHDYEIAITSLSNIPHGISVREQYIPLDAIEIFLVMGYEAICTKKYAKAEMIYRGIVAVTVYQLLKIEAMIGFAIVQYKKDKKPLSWLKTCIKEIPSPFCCDISPFQVWADRFFQFGKDSRSKNAIDVSVEELTIAKYLCEVCNDQIGLRLKINKCLAKDFFTLGKSSEALKCLEACFRLDTNFCMNFWKSQESKGKEEKERYPDKALERFRLLSLITNKMPGSDGWKQRIATFHLRLGRMVVERKLYEEAADHLENVREYLQRYGLHEARLAEDMKQLGNMLTKKKEHNVAKRVYGYALDITPDSDTGLKRDLLSNRSYMSELLGYPDAAINDAKKCLQMCSDWPKGHLRLGRAYLCKKDFFNAHHALTDCYNLSTSADRPKVLSLLLTNKFSQAIERKRDSLTLPKDIAIDVINSCLALLAKDGSEIALQAIEYLLLSEEYGKHAKPESICLAHLLKKNAAPTLVLSLIDKGAKLTGNPSALDVFIEKINISQQNNEILLQLIQKGVDVSKYITVLPKEPWQHTLVRLCVKLDKLNALSEVAKIVDFGVKDGKGNNILHVLARMECSSIAFNCMKLVTKRVVIHPKMKNNSGKKPADFIRNRADERFKFLEELEKTGGKAAGYGKKKKKKKKKQKEAETGNDGEIDETQEVVASTNGLGDEDWTGADDDDALDDAEKYPDSNIEGAKKRTGVFPSHQETRENVYRLIQSFVQVDAADIRPSVTIPEPEATQSNAGAAVAEVVAEDGELADDLAYGDEDDNLEEMYANDSFQEWNDEFEGLPWDVQCTAEFWKKLKDPKLASNMKVIVLKKVKLLASGDWRRKLAIRIEAPAGVRLYKSRLTQGARMIWEEAIAFSERRSADETVSWGDDCLIYTDVIRLWDFTVRHDEVPRLIEKISAACIRGKSCTVTKNLEVKSGPKKQDDKRLPRLYYYANQATKQIQRALPQQGAGKSHLMFFPPASPNDREFHILKFYALSSAMARCLMYNTGQNFDFPFQVSELEHQIIRLKTVPLASILLLGRSGTGKTTCCLYRLWSKFKAYWEIAERAGPHIPVLQRLLEIETSDGESLEENTEAAEESEAIFNGAKAETKNVMACGCENICMCALAIARFNYAGVDEGSVKETAGVTARKDNETVEAPGSEDDEKSNGSDNDENQYRHLRQLFITKNKVLCHEVKKNFRDLCNGFPVVTDHVSHLSEETVGNLNIINDLSYPLFLGSRDLLLALDATLPGKPFFPRQANGKLLVPVAGWGEKESHLSFLPVLDSDDEDEEINEDEIDETDGDDERKSSKTERKANAVKREITYTIFVHEVWPVLERKSSSGYHPSLVWTEFCSFIKGTVESLVSQSGYMSKEEYNSIGRKKAPNFSGDREVIYEMFKRYHKICVNKNLFDEFDLLHNVYKRLRAKPIQPWLFDEIYVDETQDFTEAELFLLIRCCQDPNQLFFTGDTAQSIMRGVTFRFSDLRSLFFHARNALSTVKRSPIEVPGKVHQLKYNYRSHKGILKLASSIVHLLGHFFPESFDRLEDDVGLFDGPKPVILETSDFAELALMLRGARRKTSPIEFGAHQVVLVSCEESKDSLPEELSCALVLTIYEAKGLEFDDVLLYNFFKDSQARKEWRVVNNYLETPACKDAMKDSSNHASGSGLISRTASELSFDSRPLEFDYNKHKILNSELKQLYTALTRARVNVWIYDEDRENRAPMFNFFDRLGLVEILKLGEMAGESVAEKGMFAEESSTEVWEQQGQYFYRKELWNVAYKCFKKTQNERMLSRCEAHLQAMKAYKMGMEWRKKETGSLKSVQTEYIKATELYLACGMGEEAAICLKNAKEWTLLGELFAHLGKYREAGRYFAKAAVSIKEAKDDSATKASTNYKKCGDYRNATDILYKSEKYLECIQVMKEFGQLRRFSHRRFQPPRSTLNIEGIVKEAADICVKRRDFTLLKEYMGELAIEKRLDYLRKKPGCEDVALEILIEIGRAEEAAEMYMRKGNYLKAASCTKVEVTKGICFLEQARMLSIEEAAGPVQSSDHPALHYVLQAIPCLQNDAGNLADCYYMMWVVTGAVQWVNHAVKEFTKCGNYVGLLLSNNILWNQGVLTSDVIVESLAKMLHQIGRRSAETVKMLQVYFGIEKETTKDGDVFFRINVAKLRLHFEWLGCGDIPWTDVRRHFDNHEEEEGNCCILSTALPIADKIVQKLRDVYNTELEKTEICYQFLQIVPHENCRLRHVFPNADTIQDRCNAYFAVMQMHGLLRERMAPIMKEKRLAARARWFESLTGNSDAIMIDTCHSFYHEVIGFTRYLNTKDCRGVQLASSLPEMTFVKNQITWCITKIWEAAGEYGRYSDVNLFLEAFTLSAYAGQHFFQIEVDNIRQEIKERYKSLKEPPKYELGLYNKREFRFETFHTMFMDSKQWLHDEGCLIESIHVLLRRGLFMVLRKDVPLPSLAHSVTLIEFCLSLCLVSLSRTNRNFEIYMPEFYMESIQFWSGSYQSCFNGKYSALESIDYVAFIRGNSMVKSLMVVIVELVSATKFRNFNLFQEAFANTDLLKQDASHRATSERFLILVLVILSNHRLFSDNPLSARPLINQLRKYASMNRQAPGFLLGALISASRVNTPEDAMTVVGKILKQSGRDLSKWTWKTLHNDYFTTRIAEEEKPKVIPKPQREEKEVLHSKAEVKPTVLQRPKDDKMPLQESREADNSFDTDIDLNADAHDEKNNYFGGGLEGTNFEVEDEVENEDEKKQILRGISYEDEAFEMRDNGATLQANEKRHHDTQVAIRKIQLWWRIVSAIRNLVKNEQTALANETRIEEHCSKYASDLRCIPCGKKHESREELHKHILNAKSHNDMVKDYDSFVSYRKNFVDHWLKQAEDLLDRKIQGQAVSEQEISEKIHSAIGAIMVALKVIDATRLWTDLGGLKGHVTQLQTACHEIEAELSKLDDDYNNDDDFHENNYLVEDDFQLVTRKKKGIKNFQNAHRRGGRKY